MEDRSFLVEVPTPLGFSFVGFVLSSFLSFLSFSYSISLCLNSFFFIHFFLLNLCWVLFCLLNFLLSSAWWADDDGGWARNSSLFPRRKCRIKPAYQRSPSSAKKAKWSAYYFQTSIHRSPSPNPSAMKDTGRDVDIRLMQNPIPFQHCIDDNQFECRIRLIPIDLLNGGWGKATDARKTEVTETHRTLPPIPFRHLIGMANGGIGHGHRYVISCVTQGNCDCVSDIMIISQTLCVYCIITFSSPLFPSFFIFSLLLSLFFFCS